MELPQGPASDPVSAWMQRDVATLSADATAAEAIALFEEAHISGAPVIDATGKPVGVLSSSDVARTEHLAESRIQTENREVFLPESPEEEVGDEAFDDPPFPQSDYSPLSRGGSHVRDWMTPTVVSVSPGATLQEACMQMAKESIHRLLVVEEGRLVGILTSFDVVRAMAGAG